MTLLEIFLIIAVVGLFVAFLFLVLMVDGGLRSQKALLEELADDIDTLLDHSHYHDADGSTRRDGRLVMRGRGPAIVQAAPASAAEPPQDFLGAIGKCVYCRETVFADSADTVVYNARTDPTADADLHPLPLHRSCYVANHDGKEPDPQYVADEGVNVRLTTNKTAMLPIKDFPTATTCSSRYQLPNTHIYGSKAGTIITCERPASGHRVLG